MNLQVNLRFVPVIFACMLYTHLYELVQCLNQLVLIQVSQYLSKPLLWSTLLHII